MAPPAKRQRRNIVEDDENDGDDKPRANTLAKFLFSPPNSKAQSSPVSSPIPIKTEIRTSTSQSSTTTGSFLSARTQARNVATTSPSTSPEKARTRNQKKLKFEEKGKSGDLLALFSKQAEKVQKNPPKSNGATSVPPIDLSSDPISDDDVVGEHRASTSSTVGKVARKRLRDGTSLGGASVTTAASNSSHMFVKPPRPTKSASLDDDLRPWSERFAPVNLEELAVHKKKVADVRAWLDNVLQGRLRQRLLLLKGAAGTGKTTTVRLLARELNCELLEWRNPTGAQGGGMGFLSASGQFEEFLGRGGKFGQLDFDEPERKAPNNMDGSSNNSLRKIILIEEFPNTFTRSSSALSSFRNVVLHYLTANTPSLTSFGHEASNESIIPVVMVVSETLLTTTSASADSFTAHRLLGPEIIRHPGAGTIEFNSIAPTLLQKALELVVQKEARKSGRRRTPGPAVLKRLGEIGDIRSAISSLEFLCLKGDQDADWGAKVTFIKPKKSAKDGITLTRGEQDSLELISQREATLGIFHAVGKVVYNKREERAPPNDTVEALPDYMDHLSRPKRSQVSVDTLIDEIGTDTHTFISALHENYVLSCEYTGPSDASSSVDYINGCIHYLSEADLLYPSWDVFFGGKGSANAFAGRDSGGHILRQDEMAFQVAVRGMLFSLPRPVKRQTSGPGRGADAFKMFFPTTIKLWRTKEELEGLVDMWSSKLLRGEGSLPTRNLTDGASMFRKASKSGGDSWMSQRQNKTVAIAGPCAEQVPPIPLLSLGSSARSEMVLERLPYMAHIARSRKGTLQSFRVKDIEKVVSFTGIGPPAADDSADEREDNNIASGEAWATDRPSEESSPRKKGVAIRTRSDGSLPSLPVQKLVLSDDDIEDD
jgi:cell cycle checkpoint protein